MIAAIGSLGEQQGNNSEGEQGVVVTMFGDGGFLHPYHRGQGETREDVASCLACPRQPGDFKKRPADFWREGNSHPFHHGSLLTKIRPVGLLSAISPHTVRLKILRN